MAKGDLAVKPGMFGVWAGIAAASAIAIVEIFNFALGVLYERFQLDGRSLFGHTGRPGATVGLFFDQLRTEFDTLPRLMRIPMPGAEVSLIFAAGSMFTAYIWLEMIKRRKKGFILLPLIVLVVAASPLLLSAFDLTTA